MCHYSSLKKYAASGQNNQNQEEGLSALSQTCELFARSANGRETTAAGIFFFYLPTSMVMRTSISSANTFLLALIGCL